MKKYSSTVAYDLHAFERYVFFLTKYQKAQAFLRGYRPLEFPIIDLQGGRPVIQVQRESLPAKGYAALSFRCPVCRFRIRHYVTGLTVPGSGDGLRAAGCWCWEEVGYILREARPVTHA